MKAIVYQQYGGAEQLSLQEVEQPTPKANEILIKVHAVSLNASDMEMLTAQPAYTRMWGIFKPKHQILGSDIAGTVVSVGDAVTKFKSGDEVFGDLMYQWGGLANFICADENAVIQKHPNISFAEAAALPQAATVAYQCLKYKQSVKKGDEVLIVGAGGGTGTFAIQLAKIMGANVTAIDSIEKMELMKDLGADNVIDYRKVDPTKGEKKYDKIISVVSPNSVFAYRKILKPNGIYILAGGTIGRIFQTLIFGSLISLFSKKKMGILGHEQSTKDLIYLQDLLVEGKLKSVVDKKYAFENAAGAFQNLIDGTVKGKAIIDIT